MQLVIMISHSLCVACMCTGSITVDEMLNTCIHYYMYNNVHIVYIIIIDTSGESHACAKDWPAEGMQSFCSCLNAQSHDKCDPVTESILQSAWH